jgi:hypothetical protein
VPSVSARLRSSPVKVVSSPGSADEMGHRGGQLPRHQFRTDWYSGGVLAAAQSGNLSRQARLRRHPAGGTTVAGLMAATGMGRSWVYYRLAGHAAAGRAVQVTRGCWRAIPAA